MPAAARYSQGIAAYYDLFDPGGPDVRQAASFVLDALPAGGSLLDVGAGVGQIAMAIAEGGARVTALEPDAEMFAVMLARLSLREDLAERFTPLPMSAARMARFSAREAFDASCCFAVLHLLPERQQRRLVRLLAESTRRGGKVLLECPMSCGSRSAKPWAPVAQRRFGQTLFERHRAIEAVGDGSWHTHWKFVTHHSGTLLAELTRTFHWRPLAPQDLDAMLAACGLDIVADLGGFDRSPYIAGESPLRLLVAVRR